MKKVLKSFTFWLFLVSLLVIYWHQVGKDSKSITLIYMNPILNLLSLSKEGSAFMDTGTKLECRTILGEISIYWYIGCVITHLFYGIVLDFLKWGYHKLYQIGDKKEDEMEK